MSKQFYNNPVWPGEFADPFVLRDQGMYYAYGTAPMGPDLRPFPILRSTNLTDWKPLGGALVPLTDPPAISYWAPEVAKRSNRYYLYYSASLTRSDEGHRIRVAIAGTPAGPFIDTGKLLLGDLGFTIDASPFYDPKTGKYYLYFAMDFDSEDPMGTGIAVVELADNMIEAKGAPSLVFRASAEWHIYERNRDYKGRIWPVWNCIEGPCVIAHDRHYYCFYSGGAWHGENYGVGCLIADHPMGPWRELGVGPMPKVLRGIAGQVLGPGHNSVVIGPDQKTSYMVYHAWNTAHDFRRMYIDPIVWEAEGPRVEGPTASLHLPIKSS